MTLYELDQFKAEISSRLALVSLEDISKAVGCNSPEKFEYRFNRMLADSCLGLDDGYYDYAVETSALIESVCAYLGFDANLTQQVIEGIKDKLSAFNEHRPYVFVETESNIEDTDASALDLVFMEPRCQLKICIEMYSLDCNEMLTMVGDIVVNHYQMERGKIGPLGNILGYVYFHDDETQVYFNGLGEVIKIEPFVEEEKSVVAITTTLKA
ncbi:MAG: hypothetical protein ISEC1_P0380 [Thiomicrorhabdus sp.]|nr:MAG: hypothetical protein ISEC1_P0380 [Thiomicrorhabdus sp.]